MYLNEEIDLDIKNIRNTNKVLKDVYGGISPQINDQESEPTKKKRKKKVNFQKSQLKQIEEREELDEQSEQVEEEEQEEQEEDNDKEIVTRQSYQIEQKMTPKRKPVIKDSGNRFKVKRPALPKVPPGYRYKAWLDTDTEDASLTHGEESSDDGPNIHKEKKGLMQATQKGYILQDLIGEKNKRPFNAHLLKKNVDAIPSDDSISPKEETSKDSFNHMESLLSDMQDFLFDVDLLEEVKERPKNGQINDQAKAGKKLANKNKREEDADSRRDGKRKGGIEVHDNYNEDLFFDKDEWFPRDRDKLLVSNADIKPFEEDSTFLHYNELDRFLRSPDVFYKTIDRSRNKRQGPEDSYFEDRSMNLNIFSFARSKKPGQNFSTLHDATNISKTLQEEPTQRSHPYVFKHNQKNKTDEPTWQKIEGEFLEDLKDHKIMPTNKIPSKPVDGKLDNETKKPQPDLFFGDGQKLTGENPKVKFDFSATHPSEEVSEESSSYDKSKRLEDSLDASKHALYEQQEYNLDLLEKYNIFDVDPDELNQQDMYAFSPNPLAPYIHHGFLKEIAEQIGHSLSSTLSMII